MSELSLESKFERFISNTFANVGQSFYDSYVEANVNFRSRAGSKTYIIRRQVGKCCKWCAALAGIYESDNAPADIYRRHQNCRCLVTFKNEKGYTDVWSKKEFETQKEARIQRLSEIESELKQNNLNSSDRNKLLKLKSEDKDIVKPKNIENEFSDYNELKLSDNELEVFKLIKKNTEETGYEYVDILVDGKSIGIYTSKLTDRVFLNLNNIEGEMIEVLHSHTNSSLLSQTDLIHLLNEKIAKIGNINDVYDVFTVSIKDGIRPSLSEFMETYDKIHNEVFESFIYEYESYSPQERTYLATKEVFYRITRHFNWYVEGGNIYDK